MQCHVTLVLYVVEYLTKVLNKKKKTKKKNVPRCAFVVAILLLASFVLNSSMLLTPNGLVTVIE